MKASERTILHVDCDAFYASVECLYNPALRGRPVAVVGDPELRHGIVLAKSQEAKLFGVQTGDALWQDVYKRQVEEGPAGEVLASPLHPYTAGLLAAMPSRGMNPLPPPDPSVPATGCPFAARCTQRLDRCTGTVPPMRAQSGRKARCYLHADG